MSITHTWIVAGERTMHCGGCSQSVEFALSRLPEVHQVKADFRTQRIEVETSDQADLQPIVNQLRELDYTVKEITGEDHTKV